MRKDKRIGKPLTVEGSNETQLVFDYLASGKLFRVLVDKERGRFKIRSPRLGLVSLPFRALYDKKPIDIDFTEGEFSFLFNVMTVINNQDTVKVFTGGIPAYAFYSQIGRVVLEKQLDELTLHLPPVSIKGDYLELQSIVDFLNIIDPQLGLFIFQVVNGSFDQRVMLMDKNS